MRPRASQGYLLSRSTHRLGVRGRRPATAPPVKHARGGGADPACMVKTQRHHACGRPPLLGACMWSTTPAGRMHVVDHLCRAHACGRPPVPGACMWSTTPARRMHVVDPLWQHSAAGRPHACAQQGWSTRSIKVRAHLVDQLYRYRYPRTSREIGYEIDICWSRARFRIFSFFQTLLLILSKKCFFIISCICAQKQYVDFRS